MKPGPLKNLSLAVTIVILLAIVTSPVLTVWMIRRDASRIVSNPLQGLATSSLARVQMAEGFLDTVRAVNGSGLTGPQLSAKLEEQARITDAHYAALQETLQTEKERSAFDMLNTRKNDYRATRKEVVDLFTAGKTQEANALFESQCVAKFQAYSGAVGTLIEHNAAEARHGGAEIVKLCHILLGIQALLLVFFFVYGFFVPFTAVLEKLSRRPIIMPD